MGARGATVVALVEVGQALYLPQTAGTSMKVVEGQVVAAMVQWVPLGVMKGALQAMSEGMIEAISEVLCPQVATETRGAEDMEVVGTDTQAVKLATVVVVGVELSVVILPLMMAPEAMVEVAMHLAIVVLVVWMPCLLDMSPVGREVMQAEIVFHQDHLATILNVVIWVVETGGLHHIEFIEGRYKPKLLCCYLHAAALGSSTMASSSIETMKGHFALSINCW